MGWASMVEDIAERLQSGLTELDNLRTRLAENIDHFDRAEPLPVAKRAPRSSDPHPFRAVGRFELARALEQISIPLAKAKELTAQFAGILEIATDPKFEIAIEIGRLREELRQRTAEAAKLRRELQRESDRVEQIKKQRRVEVKRLNDENSQLRKTSPRKGKPSKTGKRLRGGTV